MQRLYELLSCYVNFFQPVRKPIARHRIGARTIKRYDLARTPYQRLLTAGVLDAQQRAALNERYLSLNPVDLRAEIDAALDRLWKVADHSRK